MAEQAIKQGVLDETLPSSISDNGATYSTGLHGYPLIITTEDYTKMFHLPNGVTAPALKIAKLHHKVR